MVPAVLVKQSQQHPKDTSVAQQCGPTIPMGTQHSQLCMTASQGGKVPLALTNIWTPPSGLHSEVLTTMPWELVSLMCFNRSQLSASVPMSGTAPQYLFNFLQPYTPARQLRSASDTRTFVNPHVNMKTFGERSFSYAGPSLWNNLPQMLHLSDSASSFKATLMMLQ